MITSLDLFKYQLNSGSVIDNTKINELIRKTYSSGREIKIGDNVLFGFLKNVKYENIIYTLCTLHQDELDTIYNAIGYMDYDLKNEFPILVFVKNVVIIKNELKSKKENVFKSLSNDLRLIDSINEFALKLKKDNIEIFEQEKNILITENGYYLAVFVENIELNENNNEVI